MDEHLTMEEQLVALMRRDEIRSRERTICISRFWRYPGPTTAEHEADLPAELQDWSQLKEPLRGLFI
jgi:hypothetical protein